MIFTPFTRKECIGGAVFLTDFAGYVRAPLRVVSTASYLYHAVLVARGDFSQPRDDNAETHRSAVCEASPIVQGQPSAAGSSAGAAEQNGVPATARTPAPADQDPAVARAAALGGSGCEIDCSSTLAARVQELAMASLFLAGKVEGSPQKIAQFVKTAVSVYSGQPPRKKKKKRVSERKAAKAKAQHLEQRIFCTELYILDHVAFNVNIDYPHKYALRCLLREACALRAEASREDGEQEQNQVDSNLQAAAALVWKLCNRSLRSPLSAYFRPAVIAVAAVHISLRVYKMVGGALHGQPKQKQPWFRSYCTVEELAGESSVIRVARIIASQLDATDECVLDVMSVLCGDGDSDYVLEPLRLARLPPAPGNGERKPRSPLPEAPVLVRKHNMSKSNTVPAGLQADNALPPAVQPLESGTATRLSDGASSEVGRASSSSYTGGITAGGRGTHSVRKAVATAVVSSSVQSDVPSSEVIRYSSSSYTGRMLAGDCEANSVRRAVAAAGVSSSVKKKSETVFPRRKNASGDDATKRNGRKRTRRSRSPMGDPPSDVVKDCRQRDRPTSADKQDLLQAHKRRRWDEDATSSSKVYERKGDVRRRDRRACSRSASRVSAGRKSRDKLEKRQGGGDRRAMEDAAHAEGPRLRVSDQKRRRRDILGSPSIRNGRKVIKKRRVSHQRPSSRSPRRKHSSRSPLRRRSRSKSPVRRRSRSKSPVRRRSRSKSPVRRRSRSKSPMRRRIRSKSPMRRRIRSKSPIRRRSRSRSPIRRRSRSKSPIRRRSRSKSPIRRRSRSRSPIRRRSRSKSPIRRRSRSRSPVRRRSRSRSPVRRRSRSRSPVRRRRHGVNVRSIESRPKVRRGVSPRDGSPSPISRSPPRSRKRERGTALTGAGAGVSKFHSSGGTRSGFSHGSAPFSHASAQERVACRKFLKGRCNYGTACKFAHHSDVRGRRKVGQRRDRQ